MSTSSYVTTQPVLQPYLVDNEGNINFPVLGELKLGGLTKREAEQLIIDKIEALHEGDSHCNGAYGKL